MVDMLRSYIALMDHDDGMESKFGNLKKKWKKKKERKKERKKIGGMDRPYNI